MNFILSILFLTLISEIWTKDCANLKSNTKLFCYYGDIKETTEYCQCTHVILPERTQLKDVESIRKRNKDVKILITVREFNENLVQLLKGAQVDGVELNLKKIDEKNDVSDFVSTVKSKLGSNLYIAVSIPPKTEVLAKYFDFKSLSKHADVFVLNTAFLGASHNVTFHPSRLSGLWDMQNTDSLVDLVTGLGAPLSKLVISAPVQAFQFTLQNETYTSPGSPATEVKSIDRNELCEKMREKGDEWTLERDQDQAGPYIFRGTKWIAFEDDISIDIKTKYARVRGLGGIALKDLLQDSETKCGPSLLDAAFKGLSKQARAPRGAVLHTLEREIQSATPEINGAVHASPFRISRVIDTEGKVHVIRQDTRTEFECSRQGYFVHPRSCNRFYRCVKFDQRTDEYNVFEFDCPAGLAFDEKTEVCVWPGSLPHASACSGSSEIAPVPQKRFSCPSEPGYYADPENCRWFFACLDHGEPSMQAYEFRCPFGLVFDEEKLLCEWSWRVPKCGTRISTVTVDFYGGASSNINQYDGLGVLQTVKLGGLQGPIQIAPAKTYSNVGIIGTSSKVLNDNQLIGRNSAQFIDASKRLGLTLKATQSLYNAGLLNQQLTQDHLNSLASGRLVQGQDILNLGGLASEVNHGLSGVNLGQHYAELDASGSHQNYLEESKLQLSGLNLNENSNGGQSGLNLAQNFVRLGSSDASLRELQGGQYYQTSAISGGTSGSHSSLNAASLNLGISADNQQIGDEQVQTSDLLRNGGYGSKTEEYFLHSNLGQASNNLAAKQLNLGVGYQNIHSQNLGGHSSSYFNLGQNSGVDGIQQYTVKQQNIGSDASNFGYSGISTEQSSGSYNQEISNSNVNLAANQYQFGQKNLEADSVNVVSDASFGSTASPSVGSTSSSYIDVIPQVNPSSVSPTTATLFESIVSATPLKTIDTYKQEESSDTLGTQYSVDDQSKSKVNFEIKNKNEYSNVDSTYQQPEYISSTSSPALQYTQEDKAYSYEPSIKFQKNPQLIVEPVQVSTVSPLPSSTYSYTKTTISDVGKQEAQKVLINPVVSLSSIGEKGIIGETIYSQGGGYTYEKPSISFEENPGITVTSTSAPLVEKPIVAPSAGSSFNYFRKETSYNKPSVVFKEQVAVEQPSVVLASSRAPAVSSYHRQDINNLYTSQEVIKEQPKVLVAPTSGTSYSYINHETNGYKYDKPSVTFEEQPKLVLQPQISSYPKQVVQTQTITKQPVLSSVNYVQPQVTVFQQPHIAFKQPQAVVTSYFNKPQIVSAQPQLSLEQTKVVENEPQILQHPAYVSSTQTPILLETKQEENLGYKYEKPIIAFEDKPQVIKAGFVKPSVSTSYAINTAYSYDKPSVLLENKQPAPSTYEYIQPIIQQPRGFSKFYGYDYPRPQVQLVEEPKVVVTSYENKVPVEEAPIVPKKAYVTGNSFQYQNNIQKIQPIQFYSTPRPTYVSTVASVVKKPIQIPTQQVFYYDSRLDNQKSTVSPSNAYLPSLNNGDGYKYTKPQIQLVETPKTQVHLVEEPKEIVTSYENRAPIVPKKAYVTGNSYQYQKSIQNVQPIQFYSTPRPTYVSTVAPVVRKPIEIPAQQVLYYDSRLDNQIDNRKLSVSSSNTYLPPSNNVGGYKYPKPRIQLVESPKIQTVIVSTPRPTYQTVVQSVVSQKLQPIKQDFVYYGNRLSTTPATQVQYLESTTVKPPVTVTATYLPPVVQKAQQVEVQSYAYSKPQLQNSQIEIENVQVQPRKQVVVENYVYQQNAPKLDIIHYTTPRPTVTLIEEKKAPVQVFTYYDSRLVESQTPKVGNIENQGYDYPKPQVKFEEVKTLYDQQVPLLKSPTYYTTSRPTPTTVTLIEQKKAPEQQIFTYYDSRLADTQTPKVSNIEIQGYDYPKPQINFEEVKTTYQKQISLPKAPVYYSTPRPTYQSTVASVIIQKQEPVKLENTYYDNRFISSKIPQVKHIESTPLVSKIQNVELEGYDYPKPQVKFEEEKITYENKVPVVEAHIVPKKAYVTTGQSYTYHQKADVKISEPKPIVLEDYVAANYQEYTSRPKLEEVYYTTPKPTPVSVITQKLVPINQEFTYYDSRQSSTPKPQIQYLESSVQKLERVGYNYPKPKVQFVEEPKVLIEKKVQPLVVENYVSPDYNKYEIPLQTSTVATVLSQRVQPIKLSQVIPEVRIKSTSSPVVIQKLEQEEPSSPFYYYDSRLSTTEVPEVEEKLLVSLPVRQEVTSFDSRYSTTVEPLVKVKSRPNLVIIKQDVSTIQPTVEYSLRTSTSKLGIKYADIEVDEPSSTYLPIRKKVKSTTQPSREYLPTLTSPRPTKEYLPVVSSEYLPVSSSESPAQDGISVENYENFELVRKKSRPVKVVKIVRPRVKTVVVKKNDFNPFLSAKLGAQCTCTSNTLELRSGESVVVENYEAGNEDVPEIKFSTTELPSSTYTSRKKNRGRTRVQNIVIEEVGSTRSSKVDIEASGVKIKTPRVRVTTPRVDIEADEVTVVKTKGGRRRIGSYDSQSEENIDVEVNAKAFDRYGPGGVRSSVETLQGIDCQRAGLFRHPSQCNKFYSCRWDCKKNKFTLHMFNCPVHLTFDNNLGACNWPSQGPACLENTLLPSE
ncbi:hypothetical protein HHI36_015816 [Cryptolaemus montrouzieri]|uniref:Chitinase n=1 Tax=Cryptolaemus montrouzieri TaxID=559131 RepID=A0ABD2N726_9CUCU